MKPENAINKFAVAVEKELQIVGHLSKGESGRFTKTIFYIIRVNHGNPCQVELQGKRGNLDNREGLQVSCTLQFSEEEKYLEIKKKFTVLASVIVCCLLLATLLKRSILK